MIALMPNTPNDLIFAQTLSVELGLPLHHAEMKCAVVLMVSGQDYWLRRLTPSLIDWKIDFTSPEYQHNFAGRTRHNDPLSRAIGLHKKQGLRVLDMTAGLGKDALWLSQCGADVTMVERHPVLAFLLNHAAQKLKTPMRVICADAKEYLSELDSEQFDVAYYDPMFEPRTKTALVKKDMQLLQSLHGNEPADPSLIPLAQSKCAKVVVKRGKSDPVLSPGVHHQLMTKVTRFDVY